MAVVEIEDKEYEKKNNNRIKYYLDDRIKKITDKKIKGRLEQSDRDFFVIVDGKEGSGKSWFAIQWAKYADPSFNLKRIVFTPDQFKDAIFNSEKGQAIIYDEAFNGLGSRSSLSGINRYLVSLAMQIRQKNLFIILVLPSVFLLDKYFVMHRAKGLVHIYETKNGGRGYFKVFNNEKLKEIVITGKSTYSYNKKVKTRFKGRFYGKFALGEENEEKYRKLKEKSLTLTEKCDINAGKIKYRDQRDVILFLLRKNTKFTYQELSNLINDYDIELSYQQIQYICAKFGDTPVEKNKEEQIDEEIESFGLEEY